MESESKINTDPLAADGVKAKELKIGAEQRVVIVNIDMKIMDMANFMVKWAIATIPAAIVMAMILMLAIIMITGSTRILL